METRGLFTPETAAEARERYEAVGPTAQTVTREVARAMGFDREEYRERVTGDVVATARDAIFASLLVVTVGTREEFDAFRDDHPDYETVENGSPNVDRVVWHAAPATEQIVAATFQEETDAAVAALRRMVHGRIYRDLLDGDPDA